METVREKGYGVGEKTIIALLVSILLLVGFAIAVSPLLIPQYVEIETKKIQAYWGADCTQTVTSMDWGVVGQGEIKTNVTWIQNEYNLPVTLNFTAPNIPDYLALSWDYSGATLPPNSTVAVTWTLTVDVDAPIGTVPSYTLEVWGELA